jgi:hypothetical protein
MKYTLLILLLLVCHSGQSQSYEGTVKHRNRQQPAAILEVAHPEDMVMAAMAQYLNKKMKSAETDIKGFATFRNSQMPDTGLNADLYFKVERKSARETEVTVISLLITTLDLSQVPPDTLYYLKMKDAKAYLDDLAIGIAAYDLEKRIDRLRDDIYFEESVYSNLDDDARKIERDKTILEERALANNKILKAKRAEIDLQKKELARFMKQRKQS